MENNLQPKVSVIVPIYNVEKYIERCARSLMEQTLDDIEYLFVNDATPDRSMEILNRVIEDYPKRKPQIKIFYHEVNKGLSAARNTGINFATGKYLFFVDSDDEITKDSIETQYSICELHHSDLVIADNYIVKSGNIQEVKSNLTVPVVSGDDVIKSFVEGRWYNVAWNKLVRRDIIIDNNLCFSEGDKFEDELWSFQLATVATCLVVIHTPTYYYYIRSNSIMTTTQGKSKWIGFVSILDKMSRWIKEKKLESNQCVGRFFLLKLVQTLSNIRPLDFKTYKQITNLKTFCVCDLYKQNVLSQKERISYRHFDFKPKIGFVYYKLICFASYLRTFIRK